MTTAGNGDGGRYNEWARRRLAALPPRREKPGPKPGTYQNAVDQQAKRVRQLLDADKKGSERKTGPTRARRARMVVPTEERLRKGDQVEWVNPAEIDSAEQGIGLTRRFRASHLDRLFQTGRLTWVQWYAGDWYRNQHAACAFALSVVGGYGVPTSAGETSYGLPRTEAQARARQLYMRARQTLPLATREFVERLLLEDVLPKTTNGRFRARQTAKLTDALDELADWLGLPTGKRPVQVAPVAIGIDLAAGGDSVAVAVVDGEGKVREVSTLPGEFFDEDGRMLPFEQVRLLILERWAATAEGDGQAAA